jgi:hypothetical protein
MQKIKEVSSIKGKKITRGPIATLFHCWVRFMAFFSLTMVLISTCTFVISTIDELQENEKESPKLRFLLAETLFCMYFIQNCFICRPADSTVSEDTGIKPRTLWLWHWQSDAVTTWLDLIPYG